MTWLINLVLAFYKLVSGQRKQTEIAYGEAIQKVKDGDEKIAILHAELQASVDSPDTKSKMEQLIHEHRL